MNTRKISLTCDGSSVVLDINPAEIEIRKSRKLKEYALVSGDYVKPTNVELTEIRLTTFLPSLTSDFNLSGESPETQRDKMLAWMNEAKTVQTQITNYWLGYCYVTAVTTTAKEGDEDMGIEIELRECPALVVKELTPQPTPPVSSTDAIGIATCIANEWMNLRDGPNSNKYDVVGTFYAGEQAEVFDQSGKWYKIKKDNTFYWAFSDYLDVTLYQKGSSAVTTHTMKSTDTLWDMAALYYGDGSLWTRIAADNNISNPNNLPVGSKLVIK